ncbi:MAG: PAS domain S-box protein [bacterium]|nr:PAS domain S-box protein [bacterium]
MESKKFMSEFKSKDQLALLKHLADDCPDGVYIVDVTGDFIYVNEKSCEALGYTREELLELSVMNIDPWYDNNEWPHHWKEVSSTAPDIFETRHRRKDGSTYPVQMRTKRYKLDGQEYLIAFERDIAEISRLNVLVTELEKRLEIIFSASQKPIMVLDDKGYILSSNNTMCDALGYSQDSMTGKRIDEFLDQESKQHFADIFSLVLQDDNFRCDVVFIGKNGNHVHIQCTPKVITDKNEEITSVVLLQEIV